MIINLIVILWHYFKGQVYSDLGLGNNICLN